VKGKEKGLQQQRRRRRSIDEATGDVGMTSEWGKVGRFDEEGRASKRRGRIRGLRV